MINIKIAIAEDSEGFRTIMLKTLEGEGDLDIMLVATSGRELIQRIATSPPDVIIMDIQMPEMDGIQATKVIRANYPHIKIIVFTQFDFERNIIEMSSLGVKSFIGKNQMELLAKAIRIIYSGGVFFPDVVAEILQRYLFKTMPASCPFPLTELELLILHSICDGKSSVEIGETICKSPRTVEKYRESLYKKFEVNSKEKLIALAIRWNLT